MQQLEWNADLVTLGLLANRVNTRRAFDRNALEQLRDELGEVVMEGVLTAQPRNTPRIGRCGACRAANLKSWPPAK